MTTRKKGFYRRHSFLGSINCADNATEDEVRRGLILFQESHTGFEWERFFDVKDYMRSCPTCHAPISKCPFCAKELPQGAMPPKRRSDFWALYNGTFYLLECKSSTSKQGFLGSLIKPHQIDSLERNYRAGGKSIILLSNRSEGLKPRLLLLGIGDYLNKMGSRVFIPWTDLEKDIRILDRLPFHGEPYFPMDSIFQ